ncbi:chaperone protein DnaJ-like [Drosophila montana]|uniref:chaperone protein DnaJ-like n=1 Tax=Drosophila montana TaxID=40370 RepID=UPI00313CB084
MVSHDPYEILGVRKTATKDEVTNAYRELLAECYLKDIKQFKLIVRAYLVLTGMEEETPAVRTALQPTRRFNLEER